MYVLESWLISFQVIQKKVQAPKEQSLSPGKWYTYVTHEPKLTQSLLFVWSIAAALKMQSKWWSSAPLFLLLLKSFSSVTGMLFPF